MRVSTSIKLEKENRDFAKEFFKNFNLTLSDGINMYLSKIAIDKKLPFELELPNEKTMASIKQAQNNEVTYNHNISDLMKDLRK
ncbi:MAG: type II toxin-antitoxin system RelB/DinJ family antitoxin [Thermodesulfobacteriota bacterium]|nr:type II toxin-antitoxin system RelB/DinJ family antitoxin [Thermodesulfobacteriota bacterium]